MPTEPERARRAGKPRGRLRARAWVFALVLVFPGPLFAQESTRPFSLLPADELRLDSGDRPPVAAACPEPRLLPTGQSADDCWSRSLALSAAADGPRIAAASPGGDEATREEKRPRRVLGALLATAAVAATAANSTLGYEHRPFHVDFERFFGAETTDGGADKAAHFVDYHIAAKELIYLYRLLGYSEREALWTGFGVASLAGLVNEVGDGFTHHGFSPEDLAMDVLGAGTATVIAATRTGDLVGFRTSHLPGATYIHDVYSADLKFAGVANRLGANIGPLRFLLFSVTYGVKGYRSHGAHEDQERQVGFEIGLNLEEILRTVGVRRDSWWGYPLRLVGDNVRFPYLSVGFRYDLDHGKWRGPNNGNYP
jgi:hypothetical protein